MQLNNNESFNGTLPTKPTKHSVLPAILIVVIVLLLGGGAFGYYMLDQDRQAARNDVAKLETELKQLKEKLAENDEKISETNKLAETKKVLEAAFIAHDNARMIELMASKVVVVLAASEGLPAQLPADAVDYLLDYMKDAGAWNFALPETEVTKYKQGSYKIYLEDGFSIGKSSKGYVVSFSVDEERKVNKIFISATAELL